MVEIQLPNLKTIADQIERGDGDTYGLGDWKCVLKASIDGAEIVIVGSIIFEEKANDQTTISGKIHQRFAAPELEKCRFCSLALEQSSGSVGGPNIGARGFRNFDGTGIIRRARVQTDSFGDDAGRIGGVLEMDVLRVIVRCDYAGLN